MHRDRYVVNLIVVSHFSAMFVAFSIPPFLATILSASFENGSSFLGLCYAAPAVAAFAAYHARKKLTEYLGEKNTLLTSYIGVSAIMLFTGTAKTPEEFLTGLILQGAMAPTFATSSSYLACWIKGEKLVSGISALQIITRIAAAAGPSILGVALIDMNYPIHIYLILASLTFFTALLLIFFLPQVSGPAKIRPAADGIIGKISKSIVWKPYLAQILLLFSITASAPHFISYLQDSIKNIPTHLLGVIFAIPSIAYLCCVPFLSSIKKMDKFHNLLIGFLLVTAGYGGQWLAETWIMVAFCQVGIGIGTFIAFTSINIYLASSADTSSATKVFFKFELTGRSAMAVGAIVGDMSVSMSGLKTPFLVSGTTMALSLLLIFFCYSRN